MEVDAGLNMIATRGMGGAMSLSSSTHLPPTLGSRFVNPVVLPPGRARLATKPWATGSLTPVNTIGTVCVACCAPRRAEMALARIRSGARLSNAKGVARSPSGLRNAPPIVDREIATDGPAQLLEALLERGDAPLGLRITLSQHHQHPDPPHAVGLLRPHRQRPRRRTAEQRDERAALHHS